MIKIEVKNLRRDIEVINKIKNCFLGKFSKKEISF